MFSPFHEQQNQQQKSPSAPKEFPSVLSFDNSTLFLDMFSLHTAPRPLPNSHNQPEILPLSPPFSNCTATLPSPVPGPPPGLQERPKCIYVGNLDPRVTEFHLRQMFSQAGKVSLAKIINDRNVYRGGFRYGFVEYGCSEEAELALMTMNGKRIYGTEIRVNWAYTSNANCLPVGQMFNEQQQQSQSNSPVSPSPEVFHVFVGDLSQEVNDYVLANAFSHFGSFCEARIMWDFVTGRSRGFGFVAFKERRDADQAIATMNGVLLGSRQIRCNWACYKNNVFYCPKSGSDGGAAEYAYISSQTFPTNCTVYLGNLPNWLAEESEIRALLQQVLQIEGEDQHIEQKVHSIIKVQPEKGFCFVKFVNHAEAVEAILRLNGLQWQGKELKCFWGREREYVLKRRVFG